MACANGEKDLPGFRAGSGPVITATSLLRPSAWPAAPPLITQTISAATAPGSMSLSAL
jgi:hypothetical protein